MEQHATNIFTRTHNGNVEIDREWFWKGIAVSTPLGAPDAETHCD